MIDNIWFYTLSTTAQVLAALAGLFAVFVVWKIQDFEKSLFEIRFGVIRIITDVSFNTQDYKPINRNEIHSLSDSKVLEIFSELLLIKNTNGDKIKIGIPSFTTDNLVTYSLDEFTENLYKNYIDKKSSILKSLKDILIINFTTISVCIFYLTFSNFFDKKFLILIGVCFFTMFCLYSISNGIYKITTK